jgi:predicted Fe-S protein YdhL (DUF1289 family)
MTGSSSPASPCTDICIINPNGLCRGCTRTLDEIAEWGAASDDRKRAILAAVALRRGRQ